MDLRKAVSVERGSALGALSLASRIFSGDKPRTAEPHSTRRIEQLEFKQSSAQFPKAGETLCAFMNGRGGQVLVGIRPDGSVMDQSIADKTLQELAQVLRRFDLPVPVETERITHMSKHDGKYHSTSMDYNAIDRRVEREVEPKVPITIALRELTEAQAKA